jgi:pSer/pThr/pTyr-binding forkhead associated (FHA) protein
VTDRNPADEAPRIAVTYMSGPLDGTTLQFALHTRDRCSLAIGRRDNCDIHIPQDNQVSRLHARLTCEAQALRSEDPTLPNRLMVYHLEDADSRNGTFIEGDPHPIAGETSLRPGTLFRVGRTWLRIDVPMSTVE